MRYVKHQHVPDAPGASSPAGTPANTARPHFGILPSLMRTAAIRGMGRFDEEHARFEQEFALRYTAAGWTTVFFDAVVCMRQEPGVAGQEAAAPAGDQPDGLWRWQ